MSQGASGGHRWRSSVGTSSAHGSSLKTKQILWTGLAVLLGALSLWLLTKFFGIGKPLRSQIVSIGMTYDNPAFRPTPFLLDSASAFDELRQRDESQHQFVASNYPPGTKLDGPELLDIFGDLSLNPKKENLLVYLNLQGGVIEQSADKPGVAACFLTLQARPDSLPDGAGGQRVLVQDLLKACGQAHAANVIVLLEAGDCGPNWRAGILNRDFVAQLKKEAEQAVQEFPQKLRVIGAVSDGESAQASRQFGDGSRRSAFSHFAVQGLLGEADDWSFDPDAGTSSRGNARKRKVRTVSFDELFAYLHGQVGAWSRSHRAASQTVWRFPEISPTLELAQIDSGKVRHAKPAHEVVETGAKSSEKDSAVASKDSPKDLSADKSEKKSADSAGADSSKPTTVEATKDSKPSDKAPADSDKEPSVAKPETATADNKPKPDKNKTPGQLEVALFDLWKQRDHARQEGLAALIAPREWRRLQLELVHIEQCLRGGDALDRVEKDLQQAKWTLGKIVEQVRLIETQRQRPAAELVSLAFVGPAGAPPPIVDPASATRQDPSGPTADEQKQFAELLKLAFPSGSDPSQPIATPKPAPTSPDNKAAVPATEPPKHDGLRGLLVKSSQLRGRVWQEALRPILKVARSAKGDGRALAADFLQGKSAVVLADELTKDPAGRSTLPAEAVTILGVIAVAEASTKEQVAWTPDLSRACGHLIDLRERFEQFAAQDMVLSSLLRPSFAEAEVQLMAAERWVQVGQAERAVQTLGQAESALAALRKDAETLRRAAQLKANIAAELPDLARWVARQQEASGQESIKSARTVLLGLAKLPPTVEKSSSAELSDLRNFARIQDPSWFGLFDVIDQSTELFRLVPVEVSPPDGRPRPTGPLDSARLKDITSLTNRQKQSWNEWRSVDREVEVLLSATNPPVEHWTRLQDVLLVPWISAENRQRLLKQLDLLDQPDAAGESVKSQTSVVRGDWQAFWAIETLRLAWLDATSEQALWDQFAKSLQTSTDSDEPSESFAASAALGQRIAREFAKLARQADSAATAKAARQDDIDLSRGEQFTRGVDPADVVAPGTQAEFSLAKRLAREQDEFVQTRAAQAARNARLGGNVVATQWASLAERWTKLSNPTTQVVPVDESPFTLSEIANEQLFWTRGDPAEIKLSLTATPRPGMKRPETMIRVLDADSLKIEPSKITQSAGYDLVDGDDEQVVKLTIQKPKSVTAAESAITVVLLDKTTQLPWDVRRLTLRTPLKDQDWRIEFRAKGEFANRDDSAARARNRDAQSPDKYRTELRLPAKPHGTEPMSLQPVLIPPPDSKISSVSIRVFELDEKGQPRPTPSGKQDNIPITHRDGRPIALNLAAAPMAVVPPAAAGANPKPAATDPKGKDVSRGWVFEILPDGELKPIKQQVIPRVRPPKTYFDPQDMHVTFRDRELVFELQRQTDEEEVDPALRPEMVQVTLELPKDLEAAPTDQQLLWNFRRGDTNRLVALFDEPGLNKLKPEFVISLNVAGWPRAFAHKVRHNARSIEFHPEHPEIVSPSLGSVIKEGDTLQVVIQIDSTPLDNVGLDEPWQLACELIPDKRNAIPPRPLKLDVFRSLHESIELISQSETEWLLTAEVRNHRVEFDTKGLRGRFSIQATAKPAGNQRLPPGSGNSKPVKIAIAEPTHAPPTPKLTVAALAKIRPDIETDWLVPVSAEDSEAGITKIAAGIDLDKDGKLGDAEIFEETTQSCTNPLDRDKREVTLKIKADRLQDKQTGKHKLLVICKNGVGNVCKDPLSVPLEFEPARGWVVVNVPNLGQKECVLFINKNKQPGAAKGNMSFELPVGEYEFQLVNAFVNKQKGGPVKVMVEKKHDKTNKVSVTLDPPTQ